MFFSTRRKENEIIARLDAVMSCATFSISADGELELQPTNAVLETSSLRMIAKLVRNACSGDSIREVTIDLANVSEVGPQWTVMFASLMELARSVNAKCRIVGLHGKAAAAASLYRTSLELNHLIGPKAA